MPQGSSAYVHLFVVYLIWGSTFVAMRAAVMGDSGFGPFSVGATRLTVASLILFGFAVLRKLPLRISKRDLCVSAISGITIWVAGNGLVMWAEQWVEAGYAALVFSTLPIWTAIIGNIIDKKFPSLLLWCAFCLALIGMAVLCRASLSLDTTQLIKPTLVILFGTLLWAMSTHLQKRFPVSCPSFISSAYQQFFGACGFFMVLLFKHEAWPHPTTQSLIAWTYLVIFGSIIAYNSYIAVIRSFSATIAMTFAYVCPVLSVIFGALLLKEPIGMNKIIGMILILGAVFIIFQEQRASVGRLKPN